jgi:signal transduction histidine kinase/ligand-binding sensor domain-containing protein
MFRNNSFLIILFVLALSSVGYTQTKSAPPYVSRQWNMDDGLPQSSVNSIIQSRDGYIWLATFGGLVRFDGVDFDVYDRSNTPGMRSDRILRIMEDHSGSLWCSTENGVLRKTGDQFINYDIDNGTNQYSPSMMAEDARGMIWAAADGILYRFIDEQFRPVQALTDPILAFRAMNEPSGVWIVHRHEVFRTFGDSIVQVMDLSKMLNGQINDIVEYPAGSQTYWIATKEEGIIRFGNGDTVRLGVKDGLPWGTVRAFFVDRGGVLWASAFNGLCRWNGTRFEPVRTVDGKLDKEFGPITQDREGNYWVGTTANGLFRMTTSVISAIGPELGLAEGKMLSLTRRRDGSMIFGTNCGGVYEWRNGRAFYSEMNKHLMNLCVWSVLEDSKGRIWTGSRQLTRFDDVRKKGVVFDSSNGYYGLDIFALFEDSKGILWIGCLNGLFRYDGERFAQYMKKDGLPSNDVRTITETPDGTLWIGTADGVAVMQNSRLTPFELVAAADSSLIRSRYVRAIHRDSAGTMWFGTYGGGIVRFKNGIRSVITTKDGLFDNIVSHIVDDGQGNFWFGCNRGIFSVRQDELNAVAEGKIPAVQSYAFGMSDGMVSAETNGGFQPSVIRDEGGNIFFPTVSGVAVVATRAVRHNSVVPPVVIEQVSVEGKDVPPDAPIIVPHDSTILTIHYAALSFSDPSKVRYRFKLEGFDKAWTEAGLRRTAYYPNIPPGEWTFRVIASNNDGVWNTVGASIPITVLPPFWMTWWFRTLILLIFLVSGPLVYYLRVTTLQREKKAQRQFAERLIGSQEQERRRIAADLHDGLGQQILIIKNRVELAMKNVQDPVETEEQLKEIAESARSAINDVRTISHGLRPIHLEQFGLRETLVNLFDQVGETSSIEFVYHIDQIDGCIPSEREINFFRIIQEGINNILKHSDAAQASCMIRRTDPVITASLWDNGKGFDMTALKEGLGMTGIRERTKILGGISEVRSTPGQGTTVLITIPIQKI